jgi:hypothetical protein
VTLGSASPPPPPPPRGEHRDGLKLIFSIKLGAEFQGGGRRVWEYGWGGGIFQIHVCVYICERGDRIYSVQNELLQRTNILLYPIKTGCQALFNF